MLEKAFSAIDLFGIPILLNFSKSQKAKSSFGGFCSLLFLGFVAWSIYNSGYELFARQKPQIIDGTTYSPAPRPLEASSRGLPLAFGIQTNDSLIDSQHCFYFLLLYSSQTSPQPISSELEKCTPEHSKLDYEGKDDYNISDYYCLPLNAKSNPAESFSVSVFCPQQENGTDEFFAKTPMAIALYPRNGLTLYDYENPIKIYYDYDTIPIVPDMIVINTWSISHLKVTTDDGWLTENEKESEYLQVENQAIRNIQKEGMPGVIYEFKVAKQERYYLRSYKRIQNVLAEVGGIANVAFTVILILITPYSRIKFSQAFVNELFEIQSQKVNRKRTSKTSGVKKEEVPSHIAPSTNQKNSHEIEMQNQNKKQNLQPRKTEPRSNLSVKKKTSGLSKSPQHFENEGLLQPQDTESKATLKFRMSAKLTQKPKVSYRKSYTQPEGVEHYLRMESPEQNENNKVQSVLELDDLVWPFDKSIGDSKTKRRASDSNQYNNVEDSERRPVNRKSVKKTEFVKENDAESSKQGDIELNLSLKENTNKRLSKANVYKVAEKKYSKPDKIKGSKEVNISVFEYFWSFVSKSEPLKEKMNILNEGLKTVDERLDIFCLLKKLRDIDKMKAILFDKDQLFLFDRTSRPDIMNRANHWYAEEYLSYDVIFGSAEEQMKIAEQRIQGKPEKSEVDQIILDLVSGSVS